MADHEHFVVGVGPSPTSERLVQAAHRLATSMGASWCAVHVSLAAAPPMSAEDRDRVDAHLALAESLGANVAYRVARSVADGLLEHARAKRARRLIVGKPRRARVRDRLRPSLVDKLVRESDAIEIDVIAAGNEVSRVTPRVADPRWLRACVPGAIAVGVATLIGVIGRGRLTPPDGPMLYLAAIMLAAMAGRAAGLFAAGLSVALYNFFFVEPHYTLHVADAHNLITFAVMFIVGTGMGTLVARLRHAEAASVQRERRTSALLALTSETAAAENIEDIAIAVVTQVEAVLGVTAVVLVPHEDGALRALAGLEPLASQEMEVARWAHANRRAAGRGTEMLPAARLLAVPLWVGQISAGVVAVQLDSERRGIDREARALLEAIARQAGLAIARLTLASEARESELRARAEELRSSLLSTVSHDLRTPLAVITGMATALREAAPNLTIEQYESLDTIVDEAARLGAILHNLLAITRVESGAELRRDWVPVEELVGAVLGRLAQRLADHRVELALEPDAYLDVDAILFEQLLLNLLENAAKHTPPGTMIEIASKQCAGEVTIEVRDRGPGLPPGPAERLFEKFHRGPGVRGAGAGLGLAVCRGIALAHGGRIEACPRADGGATFRVVVAGGELPIEDLPELAPGRLAAS